MILMITMIGMCRRHLLRVGEHIEEAVEELRQVLQEVEVRH
jgi:hypothetical protein